MHDLAYHAAFPTGKSARRLTQQNAPATASEASEAETASSASTEQELLFHSDSDEENAPEPELGPSTNARLGVKRTRRLRVGVLEVRPAPCRRRVALRVASLLLPHPGPSPRVQGTTFLNNYIVIDQLGKGSFGKVKLCLNVSDDTLYAVKVVDKKRVS